MKQTFKNRVVLVTGAGGGLGRSHALYLAGLGARVVVNDPGVAVDGSPSGLRGAAETVGLIREKGGEAVADYASVSSEEGARAMVQTALSEFGSLDAVINNAGILRDVSFKKQTLEEWNRVLEVHLSGARHVTRAAWDHFRQKKYGRVLFTTSASGLYGNFGQSNYAAAKMGLVGFMLSLKEEGARDNIFLNAIAPMAQSRMTDSVLPPDMLSRLKPEVVSPVAAYLVSPECPVTGQVWAVGAGHVARVAILEGLGHRFNPNGGWGFEDVAAQVEAITSLQGAAPMNNLMEAAAKMMRGQAL